MENIWLYALGSVGLVSLVSFVGVLTLSIKSKSLESVLIYMISFSAGALFGDAFFHLLPEVVEQVGFSQAVSFYILAGIMFSLIVEKVIHWRHCHHPTTDSHQHPFALMNLVGDAVHNFLDGLIIGAAYLISIPVGIATTVAVILHEIPQEIGDFGVLLHAGYSKKKALFLNFVISLFALMGVLIALLIGSNVEGLVVFLVPFAAGNFIYIAGADLIPEMHAQTATSKAFVQFITFALGVGAMYLLLFVEFV
ncbi:ZIP family metal transporter [Candidatus Gracilibacteria bacterium]|nr:ZIP family metal transporter [Candidatus Gracilibacteria bacterium]